MRATIAAGKSLLLLAAFLATACSPAHTGDSGRPGAENPRGTVLLANGKSLSVEVADTPEARALGYMFRESVPDGEGMIFPMGSLDIHSFWMKNCLTALDILWLDENWRIVHIEANVPPCKEDPCPHYAPMRKSLYVLEVGPGQAKLLGLEPGGIITYLPPAKSDPDSSGP